MSVPTAELNACIQAVDDAMRRGDVARASQLATQAAALGADRPPLLVLAAYECLKRGNPPLALEYAGRARAGAKRDPEALNIYAVALSECGRGREALPIFDAALRLAPDRAGFHYNKGCALDLLGLPRRAAICFERTVALQPQHVMAWGHLSYLTVMRGEVAQARHYAERALKLQANEPTAMLTMATVEVEEKHFSEALSWTKRILDDPRTLAVNRAIAQGLAGDALDGLGLRAEAFRAYEASNAILQKQHRDDYVVDGHSRALACAVRLTAYFRDAPAQDWQVENAAASPGDKVHVFLVGFPRSGTTLLEQVLASHPQVEGMDECDCLVDGLATFYNTKEGLDRLAAMASQDLEPWRKAYWRRVAECDIAPSKRIFLDKMPLNSVNLCLIAKLFPAAKILFALRDPVDVVWSCFRRRFGMNAHMYELLTLEGAARYYDAVMALCEIYRAKLGLSWMDVAYERTVGDFEGQARDLCAFLGIAWTDQMSAFAAKSRERAPDTPSGLQVARGLYATAVGQWQAYRDELQPILPILEPWRRRFGY